MAHYFKTNPATAHKLTKESKKNKFYFRTLTRTDNTDIVECEINEKGYEFIKSNNIEITEL